MPQLPRPGWNSNVSTPSTRPVSSSTTTTSRTGQPTSSKAVRRKPVPALAFPEPSVSSSPNPTPGIASSSSRATPRSRASSLASSLASNFTAKSTSSMQSSSRNANIPRPRVMSTSVSSNSLKSTTTSHRSVAGSHSTNSPKSATKSMISTRSISSGNISGPSPPSGSPRLHPTPPSNARSDAGPTSTPNRLSSVSTASNYSQKSFIDNQPLPSTSPDGFTKQVAGRAHPIDDPGGEIGRDSSHDPTDDASAGVQTDRSAVKSGYGSVFGFGGHNTSSNGSLTDTYSSDPSRASRASGSFSYTSSHISQPSVSSTNTLPAPQLPDTPIAAVTTYDSSTPTAYTTTFCHDDLHTFAGSPIHSAALAPRDTPAPSPSFSTSAPASSISQRTLNNDGKIVVSRPPQPVRPPRARPPPASTSQSSPFNPSSSHPNPPSAPRFTKQAGPSFDISSQSDSRDRLSANPTSLARPTSPASTRSTPSRSRSISSHMSASPASSPRRRKDPLPSVSPAPAFTTIRRATTSLIHSPLPASTIRGRASSKSTSATTAKLVPSNDSINNNSSRMMAPKRSTQKLGMQTEDSMKDGRDEESQDFQNVQDLQNEPRGRDRAGSTATVKAHSRQSGGLGPSIKSGPTSRDSVSTIPMPPSDKTPSRSTLDTQQTSPQYPQSSSSSRVPPDLSSPTLNLPVKTTIGPTLSQVPSLTTTPPQAQHTSHTSSPPRSQPRPHGHLNSPPSPGMGVSLKQLLSKPAPPGYTSAGSASESEGHTSRPFYEDREKRMLHTRHDRLIRDTRQANDDVALVGIERDKERRREWEAERRLLKEKSMERNKVAGESSTSREAIASGDEGSSTRQRGFGLVKSASLTRLRERADDKDDGGKEKEKRPRNVLRRKTSGNDVRPSGLNLGKTSPLLALDEQAIQSLSRPKNTTYASFAPPMLPLSPTPPRTSHAPQMLASTSGSTLRPSIGVSDLKDRSASSEGKSGSKDRFTEIFQSPVGVDNTSGEPITPAKEIMMRYMRQQAAEASIQEKMETKEREAEARNQAEMEKETNARMRDRENKEKASAASIDSFNNGGIPDPSYHAAVGSSSGRVVAIGKPQDSSYEPLPELRRKRSISQPSSSRPRVASPILSRSDTRPVISPAKSSNPLPEFSLGSISTEGLDLSLSFGAESTGSGIHGGNGLDRPPEGTLQLDEVWERRVSVTAPKSTRSSSVGVFGNKTLTRKISAKWGKKGALGSFGSVASRNSMDSGIVESVPVYQGAYGGIAEERESPSRATLQERRVSARLGLGKRKVSINGLSGLVSKVKGVDDVTTGGKNLRLSIDALVEDAASNDQIRPVQTNRAEPVSTVSVPSVQPSSNLPTPPHSAPQSNPSPHELSPMVSPAPHSKGKIWNLIKRISTGDLRDKYYAPDSASSSSPSPASPLFSRPSLPPPVPALPKDLTNKANGGHSRTSLATIATASVLGSPTASGRQTPASSAHTTTSASSSKIPTPSTPGGFRVPPVPHITSSSSRARPGTGGTRSSSPVSSSDKGSSKFFNKAQSRRSSTSSYGEGLPPPPLPTFNPNSSSGSLGTNESTNSSAGKLSFLQQHIIPPSELHKLQLNVEQGNRVSSSSIATGVSSAGQTPKKSLGGVRGPNQELPTFSLPVSPSWRREQDGKDVPTRRPTSEDGRPLSPIIPTLSTAGAINAWKELPTSSLPVSSGWRWEQDDEDVLIRRPPPEDARPPSPIIPTFSTAGAINAWKKPNKTDRGRSDPPSRRSASIPRLQTFSSSPSISPPPLPSRSARRPRTSESALSSPESRQLTPTISDKNQTGEESSSSLFPRAPFSSIHPTRKSLGAMPTTQPRSPTEFDTPQLPSTFVNRAVSPPLISPRSAASAPWDSSGTTTSNSHPRPSNVSTSSGRTKKGWAFWKTSPSEREKAAKWDDLLERSDRAGGTLHLDGGRRLLSDRYPFEDD